MTGKSDNSASLDQGKVEDYVDENDIRTTVEYAINDEGKKVKV
jgi:translation initiation factor 3 subunit G